MLIAAIKLLSLFHYIDSSSAMAQCEAGASDDEAETRSWRKSCPSSERLKAV
jgi:hypothetical protein